MARVIIACLALTMLAAVTGGQIEDPNQSSSVTARENRSSPRYATDGWRHTDDRHEADCALLDEFMIDTTRAYATLRGEQRNPAITFGDTSYLVVWEDERNGDSDIYGARVGESGSVLDPSGIPISVADLEQLFPSVAFDGTNYLVVWEDERTGDSDIYGARVSVDGEVLDPAGFVVSDAYSAQTVPSVACNGSLYLVAWDDYRNSSSNRDIYGARVTTSGSVLDTQGIVISDDAQYENFVCVASNGSEFLAVWDEPLNETWAVRVDTSGQVLDSTRIEVSMGPPGGGTPTAASDGENYLVAWRTSGSDIYATRINEFGSVLDSVSVLVCSLDTWIGAPSIGFGGGGYFLAWLESVYRPFEVLDIYGSRIDALGTGVDCPGIPVNSARYSKDHAAAASGNVNHLVAWYYAAMGADIHAARVDTSGLVLDTLGILVSSASSRQSLPAVASNKGNFLVVWEDYREEVYSDIRGLRADASGTRLGDSSSVVCPAPQSQSCPAIASGEDNYLVVWQDARSWPPDLYCARVDTSGVLLDTSAIPISEAEGSQECPSVAFGGTDYFVVWHDWLGLSDYDVYGARVSSAGILLDTLPIVIAATDSMERLPAVAFGGDNYLVVWEGSPYDISAARVDLSGRLIDSSAINICDEPNYQRAASVCFGGGIYLVVWEDTRNLSLLSDIWGARVTTSGEVLDPGGIPIARWPAAQVHPHAVFDGVNFLVVWSDFRSAASLDIYGARVDMAGNVVDPSGLELINQPYDRSHPVLCRGEGRQLFLAYQGFEPHPYENDRVFGALVTDLGVQEEAPSGTRHIALVLRQNSPNPFESRTEIRYDLPARAHVSLRIYNSAGRLVRTLVDSSQRAGGYTVSWDGAADSGESLPSGIYFCRIQAGGLTSTIKMSLLQ